MIDENDRTTLTGSFTDPGTLDTHTVTIDWGDGSPATSIDLGPGILAIPATTHQYLDDHPSGTPSDDYTISVTVTDDQGGQGTVSTTVTINNVAPTNLAITD